MVGLGRFELPQYDLKGRCNRHYATDPQREVERGKGLEPFYPTWKDGAQPICQPRVLVIWLQVKDSNLDYMSQNHVSYH